jgi:hypothetical protein
VPGKSQDLRNQIADPGGLAQSQTGRSSSGRLTPKSLLRSTFVPSPEVVRRTLTSQPASPFCFAHSDQTQPDFTTPPPAFQSRNCQTPGVSPAELEDLILIKMTICKTLPDHVNFVALEWCH